MLLAGDIGGTKTNLAIYSPESGPRAPLAEATFPSARYASLEALAQEFLGQANLPVDRASLGVAGPVVGGQAAITNLPWVMDETQLRPASRAAVGNGRLSILYFRSDHCAPCVTQARFLQELQAEFGDRVAIEKIDVEVESERAHSYGVFTLPTTLVVDRTGTVRQANYGLTDARKLAGQLQSLESLTPDVAGGQVKGSAGKEGALGQQTPTKSPSTC